MAKIILSQGLALGFGILLLLTLPGSHDVAPIRWIAPREGVSAAGSEFVPAHVTAAPTLSEIPDQTIYENQTTGPTTFTVDDADTPVEALTLTAQTSNPPLVPVSQIVFGGSGITRTVTLTPTENMTGTAVITIGVSDGVSTTYGTFTTTVLALTRIYLPLTMNNQGPAPDLVVTEISVGTHNISVTIKNQGDSPVAKAFWVDAYINPDPIPTRVNQTWEQVSPYGMVWGLSGSALPMAPGGIHVLTIDDEYYSGSRSKLTETLPVGTVIYAQVDSFDNRTTYGAILEQHERTGGSYNNILGIQLANTGSPVLSWPPATHAEADAGSTSTLPPRHPQ
jgi:hypothetical protein